MLIVIENIGNDFKSKILNKTIRNLDIEDYLTEEENELFDILILYKSSLSEVDIKQFENMDTNPNR